MKFEPWVPVEIVVIGMQYLIGLLKSNPMAIKQEGWHSFSKESLHPVLADNLNLHYLKLENQYAL